MMFVKNWTFLQSLISFEKDLDVMFNYVRNEKKRLCRLQKCHFKIL